MATTILGQNALTLPVGTSSDRPGTPANGMFRYNSGTKAVEYYNSNLNTWVGVGVFSATSTGSISSITGWTIHTFTTNGTFTTGTFGGGVQVLIVGAGGGAGADVGGGGGGGGCLYSSSVGLSPNQTYTVSVGSGITGNTNGNPSSFAGLTAYGGGWGGNWVGNPGNPGGCGGGGSGYNPGNGAGSGAGSGTPGQGYPGANGQTGSYESGNGIGGGGGGGGAAGSGANGGTGYQSSITGTATYYGGGGGGASDGGSGLGSGGAGGGGPGNSNGTYYGGGAGGTSGASPSYSSYQGIVIIRYPA